MDDLYLVRHGQSTWNVQGRIQGQLSHPELTELGRVQAAAAAAELSSRGIGRLLSSDLTRARQSASIIGEHCGLEPILSAMLREQDLGNLQGLTTDEALARMPTDSAWDPDCPMGENGESARDVQHRISALLASPLVTESTGPAVLVSHGDAIRSAISLLLGEELDRVSWRSVPNGSITSIGRIDGGIRMTMWTTDGTVSRIELAGDNVDIR